MERTIHVVHVLYSFSTGGLEKGIVTLARNASPDLVHSVVCLSTSGAMAARLPSGTRVVELRKPPGNSIASIWKLSRALSRLKPTVVHTRNWSGMDGIAASRMAGIRSLVHGEHGWGMEDPDGTDGKRVRVRQFLSRWVREYTCVSMQMVSWLKGTVGIRKPVVQIYNGVDTAVYRPGADGTRARAELGLPSDAFAVGIVGRLDPIKDHGTLFRAIERVRRERSASHLLVVGDGPERARLQELAGEGVHFLGDRKDVPELLRAMDVFVLPSRNEGISNTILEAMATGLPVVATRVGGNPELIVEGETGFLVPCGDADALTAALLRYAKDPNLGREEGKAGRERVETEFSVERMVGSYEAVYRRLAVQRVA